MKRLRLQIVIVVVALVAIGLLLYGQQPVLPLVGQAPSSGGLYIEGLVGSLQRLNPLLDGLNPVDRDVDRLIFSRLIQFDAWGNPAPDLAKSWGVSVDGKVFNITLQDNATWHDGEPVTTADVVFTIDLIKSGSLPIAPDIVALWNDVEVVVFDEHNMQFRLTDSFSPFMDYLSIGILPEHILGDVQPADLVNNAFNLSPVGSGPYQFDDLIVENDQIQGVILKAYENYYLETPFIEQVVFRYFPSTLDALSAYQNGEILGIGQIDAATLESVLKEPNLNVYTARLPQMSWVLLNLDASQLPFFQDAGVRKALLTGINREWITAEALNGQGIVANSPIFPGTWAYYDQVETYPYDKNAAIEMLRQAGYTIPATGGDVRAKDGLLLSFELVHPDDPTHARIAEIIKEYWAAIGVDVTLVAVDYPTLVSDYLEPRNYQAALVDFNFTDTPDPDPYPFWHQSQIGSGQNYSQWDDRRGSEYLESARLTPNHQERQRLYKNFQIHFSRELPALPLFYPVYNYAVDAEVQGISIGPLFDSSDRFNMVREWFLVARPTVEDVTPFVNPTSTP